MTGLPALLRESALPPKRHGGHLPAKMDRVAKALERAADELKAGAHVELERGNG